MRKSTAQLPLHGGKAPPWLFQRMYKLAGAVTMAVVEEFGPEEMLQRLADPWWFQAFGCVLGFDWHSSGLTTVTCGAMKEAYKAYGEDMGVLIAGGKGNTSLSTPQQIDELANRYSLTKGGDLINASRMTAKVDSAAVQDGYQVYAHSIFFTPQGQWCVVQQGMNEGNNQARRYHWLSDSVEDFVCEPHEGLYQPTLPSFGNTDKSDQGTLLNMVAGEATDNRQSSANLVCENPDKVYNDFLTYTEGPSLFAPNRHLVLPQDVNLKRLKKTLYSAHEVSPENFHSLLDTKGVGPATVRALSLLAELVYESPAPRRDLSQAPAGRHSKEVQERQWADFSYAHGGKDGTPYPVDRETYDKSIDVLLEAVRKARVGEPEKKKALRKLGQITGKE